MHFTNAQRCLAVLALVIVAAITTAAQTASPQVLKIDPPGWWIGHSINPVRVLIRGRNLAGAGITTSAGLRIGATRVNPAGTYIFVDVQINPQANPGTRRLRITTGNGSTEAPFEVLRSLPRAGRFQGFSAADVLYLIMPDRFADGDPANNDPPHSRGI